MTNRFGVGDLIYDSEIYDQINAFQSDIPFYQKLCNQVPGSVLELCCGTGRLTIPLAEHGVDITGVDNSKSMLSAARTKAQLRNLSIPFHQQDIRKLDLGKRFDLVFIPFNSLQHIYSVSDLETVFQRVKKHLNSGGMFVFDLFNPDIQLMVHRSRTLTDVTQFTTDRHGEVIIKEKCHYDAASQINRVTWHFHINGQRVEQQLDMRCFFPLEMDMFLKYNGLNVLEKYGDFDANPFVSDSSKQIYLCKIA